MHTLKPLPLCLLLLLFLLPHSSAVAQDAAAANAAKIPAQRTKNAEGWLKAHETLCKSAANASAPVVFVGDSITQNWLAADKGAPIWAERYKPKRYVNIGLSGDKTENILWRLQNGGLGKLQPKAVVLLAGINNIQKNTPAEIAEGIGAIVSELRTRLPNAKILLLGLFPKGKSPNTPERDKIKEINTTISALADSKHIYFLDAGHVFLNEDGSLKDGVTVDGLHPATQGYRLWADAMQSSLDTLLTD